MNENSVLENFGRKSFCVSDSLILDLRISTTESVGWRSNDRRQ